MRSPRVALAEPSEKRRQPSKEGTASAAATSSLPLGGKYQALIFNVLDWQPLLVRQRVQLLN